MNTKSVINVAWVPHRSPFRYPGGKTWLVPHVRKWLASLSRKPAEFIEPFAGGAIVGLSVVFEDLAESTTLVELDEAVAAVWRVVLNGKAAALAERIVEFEVSIQSVRDILDAKPRSLFDKAFATIIRNRMNRGGILAPGARIMKNGENGKGLLSRWYPETLKRRILDISTIANRVRFTQGEASSTSTRLLVDGMWLYSSTRPTQWLGVVYTHILRSITKRCSKLPAISRVIFDDLRRRTPSTPAG